MKYLKQLALILVIWVIGEYMSSILSNVIALPGSIIGMIILFVLMFFRVIKVEQVEEVSNFFLDNIAFFFIPLGVALLDNMGVLKEYWAQLLIIIVISTITVLIVTSLAVHFMMKTLNRSEER